MTMPSLFRRGLESRARSFETYRLIILPHIRHLERSTMDTLIVVSWEIALGSVMNKMRTWSEVLRAMPWPVFQSELTDAVTAYLRTRLATAG